MLPLPTHCQVNHHTTRTVHTTRMLIIKLQSWSQMDSNAHMAHQDICRVSFSAGAACAVSYLFSS